MPSLRVPALHQIDERFRVMDRFPEYVQVLVPFPVQPLIPFLGGDARARDVIRAGNEFLADLVHRHPDRFVGFAGALPLADVDRAMAELTHCLDDLGALGVQLETNVGGVPIDHSRFEPVFAEMARRRCPIWLHPVRGKMLPDFGTEEVSRYGLWQALGWPYETSLVLARLVLGGYLERHSGLRLIVHHGGAMIPHFCGRLGAVLEYLGRIGFDGELTEAVESLPRPLDEYFRMFYADTVLFGAGNAVGCVVDYFGVDHVLFGTDMPFDPEQGPGFIRDTLANVEALGLDAEAQAKVFRGNALRLFAR